MVRWYGYKYDELNRLKDATYQTPSLTNNKNYFGENMDYDKNGNIIRLQRKFMAGVLSDPYDGDMDNLSYFYDTNSNQLMKVTDASNEAQGFKDDSNGANDTADDYDYDANGNLTKDDNKGITLIAYNHLNLPTKITFGTGNRIEYIYNATGQKLEKIVTDSTKVTSTNYLGGYQYTKPHLGTWALQFFPTAEGYVKNTVINGTNSYSYVFNYTDHLGNIRLSYSDDNNDGSIATTEIVEENNYYPFGLKHYGYNGYVPTEYKYKYNGKELQDENIGGVQLNLYDYGARNYDPALGRWMNIDPLAEKSRRWSPYNYAMDNPVFFIDPDGMEAQDWVKKGNTWTYNESITTAAQATAAGYDDFKANGSIVNNAKLGSGAGGDVYLGAGGNAHYATAEDYALANGGKDFTNSFWNGNQGGAYLYSGGFNYDSKYAGLSGNHQFLTASAFNNTGSGALPLALDFGGSVSGATGTISGRLGTDNFGAYGNANGSAFTLDGSISTGILTGEGSKYGAMLGGNLGAYALKGEYTTGFSIGGFSYQGTVGGSAASAHIGVNMGSNYNLSNGTLNVHFTENIGLGIGEKAGFEMTIPIPFVK